MPMMSPNTVCACLAGLGFVYGEEFAPLTRPFQVYQRAVSGQTSPVSQQCLSEYHRYVNTVC